MLRADGSVVFLSADDFVEKVELEHVPAERAPAIEYPLSRQGGKTIRIFGGRVPENKDGVAVARVCNFNWGRHQIVKNQRFEFQ